IMPQKKNPDVPELARGKTGRVYGHLVALLTLMKGQPLAYNKDNQEDKEPLFDTADTLGDTLRIFVDLVGGVRVRADRMRAAAEEGFSTATDLADYLVRKGLPFRDAHEAVARAVREAADRGVDLAALGVEALRRFSPLVDDDVLRVLEPEGSVASRDHPGGTAPAQVRAAVAAHRARLAAGGRWAAVAAADGSRARRAGSNGCVCQPGRSGRIPRRPRRTQCTTPSLDGVVPAPASRFTRLTEGCATPDGNRHPVRTDRAERSVRDVRDRARHGAQG